MFRCRSDACGKSVSIFRDSFFAKSRLKCCDVLLLGRLWLSGVSSSAALTLTDHSPNTVTDYMSYFRQLVVSNLEAEDTMVGGPGIIVEIDESKIAKRKHNRGHAVDGAWVVGGVERTEQRGFFVEPVADRSAETLRDIIQRHVRPGSIVYTDLWRGYCNLGELGVTHQTVNHSVHFRDPVTGVHTNTIEGTWAGLKAKIPPRNRTREGVEDHLLEFIWRRRNAERLWTSFLDALRDTSYPE